MKRIKLAAILAVASFGIGGAVIASNSTQTANVQNIAPLGQPENWVPLSPSHGGCDEQNDRECIGSKNPTTGFVTPLAYGEEM